MFSDAENDVGRSLAQAQKYCSQGMNTDSRQTPSSENRAISYWDGETLVICDPKDPRAWIRSNVTHPLTEPMSERPRIK